MALLESSMDAPVTTEPRAEQDPNLRTLLGLAWPIVISRSTQVVAGLADALMVAHLGEAALAATTTGAMNTIAVLIFPMGTIFIVSSFASQLTGKGDRAGARRYGWYGLLVAVAAGLLGLVAIPLIPQALGLFSFTPEVRTPMASYLQIRVGAAGAAVGLEALANYYGGLGNTVRPMVANVAAMILNVVGNWLLIDGHLGFAARGVDGAAWASALSTTTAFVGLFFSYLWDGRGGVMFGGLKGAEFWRMLRFGLPSGLNWFFEFYAFNFFVNVVLAGLGTTALAAMMAVLQLNSVSFMPAFGLASAGAILVGQAIGGGRKDQVPGLVFLVFKVAGVWQTLVGLAYLLLPELLFRPFLGGHEAPQLIEVGTRMLMLSAAWQLFDSAATALGESLRAAGDTAFVMWMRIAIAWLIFAPGSYYTVRHLGGGDVVAVGWIVLYLFLLAVALWLRFRSGAWRLLQLVEPTV